MSKEEDKPNDVQDRLVSWTWWSIVQRLITYITGICCYDDQYWCVQCLWLNGTETVRARTQDRFQVQPNIAIAVAFAIDKCFWCMATIVDYLKKMCGSLGLHHL